MPNLCFIKRLMFEYVLLYNETSLYIRKYGQWRIYGGGSTPPPPGKNVCWLF